MKIFKNNLIPFKVYFLKCCWYTHKIVEVIRKLFSQILSNLKSVYKYALASFNFWIISKHRQTV